MEKVLKIVMLSGGADSIGMLIKELKENNDFIHTHHIRFINIENRWEEEDLATKKTIEYCRSIRDFGFSCSTFEIPSFNIAFAGYDLMSVAHIGAIVARAIQNQFNFSQNYLYNAEVLIAGTKTECGSIENWDDNERKQSADMIFDGNFLDYENAGFNVPKITYPILELTKKEVLEYIPKELWPYISSCRNPTKIGAESIGCGMCHSCIKLTEAKNAN